MPLPGKKLSVDEAIVKARTFCNYRDRCHKELKDKLYSWGLWSKDVDEVIIQMIDENLLNEERFARSYVRGHFYQKKWGKQKISAELKLKGVNDTLLRLAFKEIEDADYEEAIERLMDRKIASLNGTWAEKRQKVSRYLLQKGFHYRDFSDLLTQKLNT